MTVSTAMKAMEQMQNFRHARKDERGFSLLNLIMFLVVASCLVVVGARSIIPWNEYSAVKRTLIKIQTSGETSISEARKSFDKAADIDRIDSITSRDIKFEQTERGLVGHFEYDVHVPLFANVYLMYRFEN